MDERRNLENMMAMVDGLVTPAPPPEYSSSPERMVIESPGPDREREAFQAGWEAYKRFSESVGPTRENLRISGGGDVIQDPPMPTRSASTVRGMKDLPKDNVWEEMGFKNPDDLLDLPKAKESRRLRDGARITVLPSMQEYLDAVPGDVWFLLVLFVFFFMTMVGLVVFKRMMVRRRGRERVHNDRRVFEEHVRAEVAKVLATRAPPRRTHPVLVHDSS